MDTRSTKRIVDVKATYSDDKDRESVSAVYGMMKTQCKLIEEQSRLYEEQEEHFRPNINEFNDKLNEIVRRQAKIENTQELLSGNLSELFARIEALETRSRVWDSLEERARKVHAKLVSEMHTDLTGVLRNLVDEFKDHIKGEMKHHEAIMYQRYGNQPSITAINVDKATEYKGFRKDGDYLNKQPGVPRDSSTPGLFLRKGATLINGNASRPVQKPTVYDGKTPWESYLTQFNIIADINGWCEQEKASFLASSLTGTALNVLSNDPPEKLQNFQS